MENVLNPPTNNEVIRPRLVFFRLSIMQLSYPSKATLLATGFVAGGVLIASVMHLRKVGRYVFVALVFHVLDLKN